MFDELLELRLGSLLHHLLGAGAGKQRVQHKGADHAEHDGTARAATENWIDLNFIKTPDAEMTSGIFIGVSVARHEALFVG